ncbi:MAG: hypothetical protein AABN95_26505 [Acidobacteriota bacterium]
MKTDLGSGPTATEGTYRADGMRRPFAVKARDAIARGNALGLLSSRILEP